MTITPESPTTLSETLFAGGGAMGALMRSHDWSKSKLGSTETWSKSLITGIRIILGSRYPMFIWWGRDLINLYNDAYISVLGKRHPKALGESASQIWSELWHSVGPFAYDVLNNGNPSWNEEFLEIMERNGYPEETYFTFSYSPIGRDEDGVGGIFCACTEDTRRVIDDRRLRTLRELGAETAHAKTVNEACQISADVLTNNLKDIPFALIYLFDPDRQQAQLIATTNLEKGTPVSPSVIELADETSDCWSLHSTLTTRENRIIHPLIGRFGQLPGGAWDESPNSAIALPLARPGQETLGVLIAGISPYRPLDDDYRGFFALIAGQVTTAIANTLAYEEECLQAEALAELDRAKTTFFSNVSHEFRTPLTLILAPLQDALSDSVNSLTSSQREQLELAHRNSLRLLKLVNTLLDFSRIEADRLKANYEPTDLSTYTAELASVFRSAIENVNLQLVVDCPPLPDPIYVDREMWEKIVLNLLSNGLKFTFEGMISVSLKPNANTVELMVSDTGVGISASELPHLFERFYQVKGAKGRSYEGSGIGLSLVQELVKRHGGAIAVTSAVDQGTTFTITIPTGIAHLPADQIEVASTLPSTAVTANAFVEEALHWLPEESIKFQNSEVQVQSSEVQVQSSEVQVQNSEVQAQSSKVQVQNSEVQAQSSEVQVQNSEVQAQSSEVQVQNSEVQAQSSKVQVQNSEVQAQSSKVQAQSSKKARILLVDDNADMRGYLRRLLNQYYEVETVNDGLAALTAIRRGGNAIYDLVLADVMMPRMDGFELLRSLRASPNTQTIPIILLSARAGEESQVEGLEIGADDYLIKPFSARELLARVDANLQLAQLRREAVYCEQVMQAVQTLNDRLEQQVKARTAQLEAINQELEAFSSSISHDLRTPLRYISSFAERLQGKLNATVVDASILQTLNIITKSALEAEKMVDDLLEFSRLGKTEMHLTTVNISQLVQQVQEQLQPELIGRSLHWEIEPLATVEGDPALLRLVLQNLLSNAVKYTRNNTEAAIKIGRMEQEQEVIFFVKDNGAGFDMKYCNRLFSIFQRLHSQEQFPGTGVGLATVRRIIHRHGGRIWAEGAIDQGATFYFSLPKREAQL